MTPQEAIEQLEDLYQDQQRDKEYYDGDWEYMDFITVYFYHIENNVVMNKNLVWCNTVNEAIDTVNKLRKDSKVALEVGDEFHK